MKSFAEVRELAASGSLHPAAAESVGSSARGVVKQESLQDSAILAEWEIDASGTRVTFTFGDGTIVPTTVSSNLGGLSKLVRLTMVCDQFRLAVE